MKYFKQKMFEKILKSAHDKALSNLTEQQDLENYGKAMLKYESKLDFVHSPEFWQAFMPPGEWANHCQCFGFLETTGEKVAYLKQLMRDSK